MQSHAVRGRGATLGAINMKNTNTIPCEHCQKAFHQHVELHYLYCGHNRIIAFRVPGRPVAYMPTSSTAEAMRLIERSCEAPASFARSA
jgi:hypothetical protein